MPAPVDISDPFRALADPTRRVILDLLAGGPLPVRMIADRFPSISRPAVSKHLRILREGRLVREERSGRERFYSLKLETVEATLGWLTAVSSRAAALKAGGPREVAAGRPRVASKAPAVQSPEPSNWRETPRTGGRTTRSPVAAEPEAVEADDWRSW